MANEKRDRGLRRHGDPDPSNWYEQKAVAGRPQDEPAANTTFADRAKARKSTAKAVDAPEAENKAARPSAKKAAEKK